MNLRKLLCCLCLLIPATALAHAELEASSIEDGATVTGPLGEVGLTFTEAAELGFSTFKVYPLPTEAPAQGDAAAGDHDEAAGNGNDADGDAAAQGEHDDTPATDASDAPEGEHGTLDAAAETLMAEVMDAPDDAPARADAGVTPATGQSETVTVRLKEGLEPGAYAVMWNVLSVDSHTIEGFLTFTYDPGN